MARGAREDGKPKGRMSAYAYFVQTCREEHKKKHPNESVVFAEFSRKCADRWKTMDDKEKGRFHTMAERDKKRHEVEMSNWVPPKGEGKGRKRKRVKDPNAPKRSLSAFFWFCNDERPKVKVILPDSTVGDVAKELGKRWQVITDVMKSKYEALAAKDKARYEKEMTAYKAKGAKSSSAGGRSAKVVAQESDEEEEEDEEEDEDDE